MSIDYYNQNAQKFHEDTGSMEQRAWSMEAGEESPLLLAFAKLAKALQPGGVVYCSFKYGQGERVKGDRTFTDMNETMLKKLIGDLNIEHRIEKIWIPDDSRNERDDKWLNAVLVKE